MDRSRAIFRVGPEHFRYVDGARAVDFFAEDLDKVFELDYASLQVWH